MSASDAPLSAAEKKQRRQQATRLTHSSAAVPGASSAANASAAAPAKPALTLAQELALAEAEVAAPSVKKGTKRKAQAAAEEEEDEQEQTAEANGDEDDEDEEEEAEAGAFAWDADEPMFGSSFAATAAPAGKTILPPSKQFLPYTQNSGTSLQHKINAQIAKKGQKSAAAAGSKKQSADSDEEDGEDLASSSEDDEDDEGSDSDDKDEDDAGSDVDADATGDVDMHAFKDDEVRRKVPAATGAAAAAAGPKGLIAAKSIPRSANPIGDFASLKLSRPLLRAINDLGWAAPTPVQAASILPAVGGKDLLVNAVTGSGKTGAFMLPILERLLYRPKRVPLSRVLVLLPTRELAAQCLEVSQHLSKYTDIRICLVVGGLSEKVQEQELRNKPDIILATPGRLIDHLRNSANVHLEDIEILVLDEADRLLENGFAEELREIIKEVRKNPLLNNHSGAIVPPVFSCAPRLLLSFSCCCSLALFAATRLLSYFLLCPPSSLSVLRAVKPCCSLRP
jgi:ATP-dependent RNA helicase DDX27